MAVVVCKTPADEDDVLEAGKIFRCLAVPHKSVFPNEARFETAFRWRGRTRRCCDGCSIYRGDC